MGTNSLDEGGRMIHRDTTLGQLVTENPARARVLEAHDLDYCCHGERTLAQACGDGNQDVRVVTEALRAVDHGGPSSPAEWATLGLVDLLDHIVATHHAYLRAALPRLLALSRKVAEVHGGRHPEVLAVADHVEVLWAELEPHLDDEEAVAFPALAGGEHLDTSALRQDHERVGFLLDRIRATTREFTVPADGCASYVALYAGLAELDADTRLHVHKENNLVLPIAERALSV